MPTTYDDADLLLRVYELRRESKLRESRDFMSRKCSARDYEEYNKKYPMGSSASEHWGKVFGYWDMVCALVDRGVLDRDLFNTCNTEHVFLYLKFRPVIEGFRRAWNYPEMLGSLERVATSHPGYAEMAKWVAASAEQAGRKPAGKASGKVSGKARTRAASSR